MFSKIVKDIFLGNHTITILEDRHKNHYAQLTSSFGSKLEFRVVDDSIQFRIANGELTHYNWVKVPLEYFIIIMKELGVSEKLVEALSK